MSEDIILQEGQLVIKNRPPCAKCKRPALMIIANTLLCGECVVKLEKLQIAKTQKMIQEDLDGL